MRDFDIRNALRKHLEDIHRGERSSTVIIEELGVCNGTARMDVAVLNGSTCGYEIKSERDTLDRLAAQAGVYNSVFDRVTLVAAGRHISKAVPMIPDWWGITEATMRDGDVSLEAVREARPNPTRDPMAVLKLIWKDEEIKILRAHGKMKGAQSQSRGKIDVLMLEAFGSEVFNLVREQVKARGDWRAAQVQQRSDDSARRSAIAELNQSNFAWLLSRLSESPPS